MQIMAVLEIRLFGSRYQSRGGDVLTESERLFEAFCREKGIAFRRIAEGTTKSPDYVLSVSGMKLIVEVKQIAPNPEEKSILRTSLDEWDPANVYHWGIPGERIRKKISNAVPQLKELSEGQHPTMLVILNAVEFWPELADAYAVQVAMYGIESALISNEVAPEGGAKILARWHGPRKRLTPEHNTTLSAIALMTYEDQGVVLRVYHNYHAAIPMPRSKLSELGIQQFELPSELGDEFPEWKEIASPT
jgi:hypothetical protein